MTLELGDKMNIDNYELVVSDKDLKQKFIFQYTGNNEIVISTTLVNQDEQDIDIKIVVPRFELEKFIEMINGK